jgi:hypothetical protein
MFGKTSASRIAHVAILVLALALVPAALAAKGDNSGKNGGASTGGGSAGSYTVSVSPAGPYTFGETVSITTNAPQVAQSYIGMSCSENGTLVLSGTHANWSGGLDYGSAWLLGPTQVWGGGAADCTVTVFHLSDSKQITDATTSFHVDG